MLTPEQLAEIETRAKVVSGLADAPSGGEASC